MKLSTTNYFVQGRKAPALMAATLAAAGLSLTACDPGRECLDYATQVVPHTTVVNGKVVTGTSVVTTCVRYAEVDDK